MGVQFFLTTTTVVFLSGLLIDRSYLSVTSIKKTRSEKPPRSSTFLLRMLLISSSVVPSLWNRGGAFC